MFLSKRSKEIEKKLDRLKRLEWSVIKLNRENKELLKIITEREAALEKIVSEKSLGFPWLANAIAEFYQFLDLEIARELKTKKHPAVKSSEAVKKVALEKKELEKKLKIATNFVNYYESLFPWLKDYVGQDLDELIIEASENKPSKENNDPVLNYIPKAEYTLLSSKERNQKALNRYLESRKKPWQIGRDYERYVGYLYEQQGFKVEYIGIEKGLEDLGRDLICIKNNKVEVVQCKCWAKHKVIHEKHINQLYGTAVKYYIEQTEKLNKSGQTLQLFPEFTKEQNISATFITSTQLSETAKKFAQALNVKVYENEPLGKYPLIKCNINATGEKIYHLPFDQQYDKTQIKHEGEFYAMTVEEAENKGFRRAFKWKGNK